MSIKLKSPHVVDLRFLMDTFRSLKTLFERVKLTVLLPYSSWVQICGVFLLSRAPDSFNLMFFGHRCVPSLTASVLIFFFPFLRISAHYCFLLQKKPSAPSFQLFFFTEPNAYFQATQGRVRLVHPCTLYQHPALLALCTTQRAASAHFFPDTAQGSLGKNLTISRRSAARQWSGSIQSIYCFWGSFRCSFFCLIFFVYIDLLLTFWIFNYGQWPTEASEKLRATFNKRLTLRLALIIHVASDYSDYCGIRFCTCWAQLFPAAHLTFPLPPQTSEGYSPLCFISSPPPFQWKRSKGVSGRKGRGRWVDGGGHGSPTPKSSPDVWQNHPPSDHHYVTASLVSVPRTVEGCDWQAPGRPLYKERGRRASQSLWCRKSSGLWM